MIWKPSNVNRFTAVSQKQPLQTTQIIHDISSNYYQFTVSRYVHSEMKTIVLAATLVLGWERSVILHIWLH